MICALIIGIVFSIIPIFMQFAYFSYKSLWDTNLMARGLVWTLLAFIPPLAQFEAFDYIATVTFGGVDGTISVMQSFKDLVSSKFTSLLYKSAKDTTLTFEIPAYADFVALVIV